MYDSDDFRDSIDDMCDDAVRRMFAFREGGLSTMHASDAYYSRIESRNEALDVIEYDTITRAEIIDSMHPNAISDELPEYLRDILAGAVIALARHSSHLGRGSDIIVPNQELARNRVDDVLLLSRRMLEKRERLQLVRYELGAIGASSLLLEPRGDVWSLLYEAHNRVSVVRF